MSSYIRVDEFSFGVDVDARQFFRSIADEMVRVYEISEREAVARINDRFVGLDFSGEDVIYHQAEYYWAKDIMYGHDVWWKGEENIEPIPAPGRRENWLQRRWWW